MYQQQELSPLETTPFTPAELLELQARFESASLSGRRDVLSYEEALSLREFRANPFAPRVFELFSENANDHLTFAGFLAILTAFAQHAPSEVKAAWLFALWDFDGDDLIGADDLRMGLTLITNASSSLLQMPGPKMFGGDRREALADAQLDQVAAQVLRELDPDGLGLGFGTFRRAVLCLPDIKRTFGFRAP
mmetsp:Transcript_16766/g.54832  ORF Transcript_16766/g.54832 Transcript_16766/m.54832 type:complete len:192 (-) Transcript_16766:52-627(-)